MTNLIIGLVLGLTVVGVQCGFYLLAMERLERLTRMEVARRYERLLVELMR